MDKIPAPAAAIGNGHDIPATWAPQTIVGVLRWTCSRCYAVAVRNGYSEYGSAIDTRCPSTKAEVS